MSVAAIIVRLGRWLGFNMQYKEKILLSRKQSGGC